MTLDHVAARIQGIADAAHDDEMAHSLEDTLRHDVLHAIAMGAENAQALAALVLETSKIDFSRWCA